MAINVSDSSSCRDWMLTIKYSYSENYSLSQTLTLNAHGWILNYSSSGGAIK